MSNQNDYPDINHYKTLGVARDASVVVIREAYLRLARVSHPDLNGGTPQAIETFKGIQLAYEILIDPVTRRQYDRGQQVAPVVYTSGHYTSPVVPDAPRTSAPGNKPGGSTYHFVPNHRRGKRFGFWQGSLLLATLCLTAGLGIAIQSRFQSDATPKSTSRQALTSTNKSPSNELRRSPVLDQPLWLGDDGDDDVPAMRNVRRTKRARLANMLATESITRPYISGQNRKFSTRPNATPLRLDESLAIPGGGLASFRIQDTKESLTVPANPGTIEFGEFLSETIADQATVRPVTEPVDDLPPLASTMPILSLDGSPQPLAMPSPDANGVDFAGFRSTNEASQVVVPVMPLPVIGQSVGSQPSPVLPVDALEMAPSSVIGDYFDSSIP